MARTMTETEIAAAAAELLDVTDLRAALRALDVDDATHNRLITVRSDLDYARRMAAQAAKKAAAPAPTAPVAPAPVASAVPAGFRAMTARYASRCVRCGGSIRPGASIFYARAAGAMHESCPASRDRATVAYREARDRTEGGLFSEDYE